VSLASSNGAPGVTMPLVNTATDILPRLVHSRKSRFGRVGERALLDAPRQRLPLSVRTALGGGGAVRGSRAQARHIHHRPEVDAAQPGDDRAGHAHSITAQGWSRSSIDQETSPPQYSLTKETSSCIAASMAVRPMSFTPSMVKSVFRV